MRRRGIVFILALVNVFTAAVPAMVSASNTR
jgi:hypothetical protein